MFIYVADNFNFKNKQIVAGHSPRRPGFDPSPVHVRFLVDQVAL
jgi:hypothetical protein